MTEITGGELKYIATIDTSQLDKSLLTSEGRLKGFSEIAKATGTTLDNSVFKKRSPQDLNIFGLTKENIKIQKQVIEDIKKQIDELRDKASNVAPGMAQASIIGEIGPLKAELAAEEQALIRLQTELGETEQKQISLTTARNQALETMRRLTLENKQGSEEYKVAEQNVQRYTSAIDQTNTRAKMLAAGGLSGVINNLGVISSGLSSGVAIMGLFNSENENLNRIMLKTQALLSVSVTLQQLYQAETQGSGIMASVLAVQEMARARATDLATAATGRATIAQRLFNVVANANPYVLLATAIITVVGAIGLYIAATSEAEKRTQKLLDLNKKIADSVAEPLVAYKNLQSQWNALGNDIKAKEKFIVDNKDKFEELGVAVTSVKDAENVLQGNSDAFVKAIMLRARAAALAQVAIENMKKSILLESEYRRKNIDKDLTPGEKAKYSIETGLSERERMKREAAEIRKANEENVKLAKEQQKTLDEINKINQNAGFKDVTNSSSEKKVGKVKKTKEQVAEEFLPAGSVAEIQKRLAEIDDALSKATGSKSIDALKQRRMQIALELAAAEKKIRIQSFDEEMAETKKHIELRDQLIQDGYDKDKVDEMLPAVKDKTYLQYLEDSAAGLKKLIEAGDGTEETAANLRKISQEIDILHNQSTKIDVASERIDNLKSKYSGAELIAKLNSSEQKSLKDATEQEAVAIRKIYDAARKAEQKAVQESYEQLLKDHATFAEKRVQAEKQVVKDMELINGSDLSAGEKLEKNSSISQKSREQISALAVEELQRSAAWMGIYNGIDEITAYQLDAIIRELESKADKLRDAMLPGDYNNVLAELRRLKAKITELNPFQGMFSAARDLFEAFNIDAENAAVSGAEKFEKTADSVEELFRSTKGAIRMFDDVREYMSDSANQTLDTIEKVVEFGLEMVNGIKNTVVAVNTAIKSATDAAAWSNWITAILQIIYLVIKAITSLVSWIAGNKTKKINRAIAEWDAQLEKLKETYEALNREIERTAGEAQLTRQRELIANLQKQQKIIEEMRRAESNKKKADRDKIAEYNAQIVAINNQIQDIADEFMNNVTTTNFKELSQNLADALIEAYGKGEDAATAYAKVVDDVMRAAVANALKIKILQPAIDNMVNQLYSSMGFGNASAEKAIQDKIDALEAQLANPPNSGNAAINAAIKKSLEDQIAKLKAQLAEIQMSGSFDGLTDAEREAIKAMGITAMEQYTAALAEYEELFGSAGAQAQGLKGDIKGITEKTAGALEAQMNAMRTYQAEILNLHKKNQDVFIDSLKNLVMIEYNTRRLHSIDDGIKELNSKVKKSLAGVP